MKTPRTFLIIAPFWRNPGHVGVYRVDRFIRWLASKDIPVVLVRAGQEEHTEKTPWGVEIAIRDPLNIHGDIDQSGTFKKADRRPNALRRWVAEWVFNPDLSVVWAKRIAKHPLLQEHMDRVTDILASSPPDSLHLGAYELAKAYNKRLILDRRDGWLDEPLKPLLQRSRIRRFMEGRLERRVLKEAAIVFVTSEVWKEHLGKRLPFILDKTTVLTNAYPATLSSNNQVSGNNFVTPPDSASAQHTISETVELLHAGRFTGSNHRQKPQHLLTPLLDAVGSMQSSGSILCLGNLEPEDFSAIDQFKAPLAEHAWTLETQDRVSREQMLQIMGTVNGLLLLSTPFASVPSKFFEYLASGKPILAATQKGSAVWRISEQLPQVFLIDYTQQQFSESVVQFLEACQRNEHYSIKPDDFTESTLSQIFFTALNISP
ncbi:MAG: hypothetical protein AB8G77_17165 [Rhodothermales bacterium]